MLQEFSSGQRSITSYDNWGLKLLWFNKTNSVNFRITKTNWFLIIKISSFEGRPTKELKKRRKRAVNSWIPISMWTQLRILLLVAFITFSFASRPREILRIFSARRNFSPSRLTLSTREASKKTEEKSFRSENLHLMKWVSEFITFCNSINSEHANYSFPLLLRPNARIKKRLGFSFRFFKIADHTKVADMSSKLRVFAFLTHL